MKYPNFGRVQFDNWCRHFACFIFLWRAVVLVVGYWFGEVLAGLHIRRGSQTKETCERDRWNQKRHCSVRIRGEQCKKDMRQTGPKFVSIIAQRFIVSVRIFSQEIAQIM